MLKFLVRRFIALIVLLIATSIVTFLLFFASPADPAADSCGKNCSPQAVEAARVSLGLDKPLYEQYAVYMQGLVMNREVGPPNSRMECDWPCFGLSYQGGARLVWPLIETAIPYTLNLALGAAVIWLIVGVSLGIVAALKRGKWQDRAAVALSAIGVSAPVPLIGLVFLWLVVGEWKILPYSLAGITSPFSDGFGTWIQNFLLPWITLALLYSASYVRLTRASMIETMGEDFIRTARAKGLPRRTVTFKHGLRAGITPIVTIFGLDLGAVLGGAALTESIYSLPGLGNLAVDSVQTNDLPIVAGVVLFAAFFIIFANIVVDILYAIIDPRVRLS